MPTGTAMKSEVFFVIVSSIWVSFFGACFASCFDNALLCQSFKCAEGLLRREAHQQQYRQSCRHFEYKGFAVCFA